MTEKQPKTYEGWYKELARTKDNKEENFAVNQAFVKWIQQNPNKYTLKISLTNQQNGREEWGGKIITFYNEDNAINHLSILESFFDLLLENKEWGCGTATDKTVDNIINPIKERVGNPEALGQLNQLMKGVELETTDYTPEQIQTILLFLENDFVWYEKHQLNPIIASYLKNRIELLKEEEN